MTPYKLIKVFIFLILTITVRAQSNFTANQEKISNALSEYFTLDRENIHLHLNKSIYLTNEQIWFKGYIIDKKNKLPYYETTNIYVALLDENGQKIASHLFYAENSIFHGNLKLNSSFKTGKYYLQVYTNYMNNFIEDESSISGIYIINTSENTTDNNNSKDYSLTDISFFPESGVFLEGISNTIGLKIMDCNGDGVEIKNGEIQDAKGNLITNFSTNNFGYGKFEIKETEVQQYKAICFINDIKIEKNIPLPVDKGIAFSVDNYIVPNRTTIKIKTNTKSLEEINKTNYSLVIQQNEAANFIDFSFKDTMPEQTFTISNDKIFDGINTIHLIDANLNKMGERIIYKPFIKPDEITLLVNKKRTDSIVISGMSKVSLANLSISIVPDASVSNTVEKNIYSSLQFDNYISNSSKNIGYYLNNFSRRKQYELDNYLLAQKSKYNWNAMLRSAPKKSFEFDKGLTVKGTINTELKDIQQYKINMTAVGLGLNEFTTLNEKNEFIFEHVIALDSTKLYFLVLNEKGIKSPAKAYSQVLNNNRVFLKSFLPDLKKCPVIKSNSKTIAFPKIQNAITLDSISIIARKNKLNNEDKAGNRFAKAHKISEKDIASYRDILHFLSNHGFQLNTVGGDVTINGFNPNSITLGNTSIRSSRFVTGSTRYSRGPAVFIDNVYVQDYNSLRDYGLETIDEIYIQRENNGISMYGRSGAIRIYSKKATQINNLLKDKSQLLLVKNGFQKLDSFENMKYESVRDEGFASYGTIDWKQNIFTDEFGNFQFSIPNLYQSKVKISIEGITNEGQMISTTKTIDIP